MGHWEGIPNTYRYKKGDVTQIQLLSDELRGICYEQDNKYGSRDLRILVYGAKQANDEEQDKTPVREESRQRSSESACVPSRGRKTE